MRTILGAACVFIAATIPAIAAPPLPAPQACASYNQPNADATSCDAAIAAESDPQIKSMLLFRRAYMKDAGGDFGKYDDAISDLDKALRLFPGNYAAFHERAYLFNEIGQPAKAEADLDSQAAIEPEEPATYEERALARFLQGKLQGAFEDRDRVAQMRPNNAGARFARARALMWLGRYEEASADLDTAASLAAKSNDGNAPKAVAHARADIKRWTTTDAAADAAKICAAGKDNDDFLKAAFIGDCTLAFFSAKTGSDRADALTQRAIASPLVEQNEFAGLEDLRLALAFDPANPDHMFNLGSNLASIGRSGEALRYLDAAIALKSSYIYFGARAGAKNDLGDAKGAFQDAKKSFELQPNELALTVLGDIAYDTLKDEKMAKSYWLGAYHLGDRDDRLKARLAKLGVGWPPPDDPPAKP